MQKGHSTRHYSSKQEKKVAEETGGRVVVNSGATPFRKGDASGDSILYECKTVEKEQKSFSIKREWLRKLSGEAYIMRKPLSSIVIDFGDNEMYYVLNSKDFMSMYTAWLEVNSEGEE